MSDEYILGIGAPNACSTDAATAASDPMSLLFSWAKYDVASQRYRRQGARPNAGAEKLNPGDTLRFSLYSLWGGETTDGYTYVYAAKISCGAARGANNPHTQPWDTSVINNPITRLAILNPRIRYSEELDIKAWGGYLSRDGAHCLAITIPQGNYSGDYELTITVTLTRSETVWQYDVDPEMKVGPGP